MSRTQEKKQKKWFFIVIVVVSIARILMLRGLVIYPFVSAGCDDALMKNWALNIVGGNWTGPFSCYTFTKEVGFAFYLAVTYCLHLPYIIATNFLYMMAVLVLLYAISHIVKQKWVLCIIYVVTLFHPIMTAFQTVQRVYRNGFATALTLLVFGSLLNLYFEITTESFLRNLIWSVLTAGSLGYLWETKSDTIWLLPFTISVLGVAAILVIRSRKIWSILPRLALLILPILGISFFSKTVDAFNLKAYGETGIAYYGPAMSILTGVKGEETLENVNLSRKTFYKLCELSPTLATTKQEVEKTMDEYDKYDTHPGDGNVENGWIGWTLLSAFDKAGYYENCQVANEFYQKLYKELSEAADNGKIELVEKSFLESYYLSTAKERKELFSTIGQIWNYVASHQEIFSSIYAVKEKDLLGSQGFEAITRGRAYYSPMKTDYYCAGWVAYPQYELKNLKVYVEDKAGNQLEQIEFYKSEDVSKRYGQVPGTEKCRFTIGWDYSGQEESPQFYIVAYNGTKQVAKKQIEEINSQDFQKEVCIGCIDGFFENNKLQENHKKAEEAVERCNKVSQIYYSIGNFLAWSGVITYIIFTIVAISQWKRKQFDTLNLWLVITGIDLSLFVLFAGVAVTHLRDCPAISYMYLSAAYPLFNLAAMLSILACIGSVFRKVRR